MAQTKAQLENLVAKYREENAKLHTKLEAHGTPHNVCDSVSEFFGTCIDIVNDAYESSKNFVLRTEA